MKTILRRIMAICSLAVLAHTGLGEDWDGDGYDDYFSSISPFSRVRTAFDSWDVAASFWADAYRTYYVQGYRHGGWEVLTGVTMQSTSQTVEVCWCEGSPADYGAYRVVQIGLAPMLGTGVVAPGLSIGIDGHLFSGAWRISGFQGLFRPQYSADTFSLSYTRTEFEGQLAALRGRPVTQQDREQLDRGCIGVAAIEVAIKIGTTIFGEDDKQYPNLPEDPSSTWGSLKAFRTPEQALAHDCAPGQRKVVFAKEGRWHPKYGRNGPSDIPGGEPGEIPADSIAGVDHFSADGRIISLFNYATYIGGKWVDMNHSASDGAQRGDVHDKPPRVITRGKIAYFVRCLPTGN